MNVIEMVKEAENKAEELKNTARNEAQQQVSAAEEAARRQAGELVEAAKKEAANILEAARQLAEKNAALIREGNHQRNLELAAAAAENKQRAAELVLSFV